VHSVVGKIFSRDPVDGRIEMSTGVLTGLESVPVPGRTTLIVVRQLPDLERRRVGKLRRKRQQRGLRTQEMGKVHHTKTPGSKFLNQLRKNLRHSYYLLTNLLCVGDRLSTSGSALDHCRFSDWIYRRNWKRFSTKERSVTYPAGPFASTLAIIVVS